ncbi:MAG: ATP-binding protein [Actinomycetota bacterium]|nr:ATP-binding protein [Actinomycetota bacterium]
MKWRLLLAMTGLITMVLVAQDVPLAGYLRRMESERLVATLQRDAFILAGASENLLAKESGAETLADLQTTIDLYVASPANDGSRVVIIDANGKLLLSTNRKEDVEGEDFSSRPEVVEALQRRPASGERPSDTAGGNLVYVAVPVLSGAAVVGVVRITFPASVIDDRSDEKVRGLLLVFGISLVGAILAAIFMAVSITSPLRRLQRSTEHLAAGNFTERADDERGPKEIRSLARSFNSMTGRIAGLVAKQRAFAGDASHQLRTPLTALRLQLERAATMVDNDPEGARDRIEAAGAETERLQRVVEGLLMIARSDGTDPERVMVDVTAMVRDRAEVWGPFAAERGIGLTNSAHDGLHALAVPNALEQIIDNYVDNALGVARDGDTITITAAQVAEGIAIRVIDEGPGMKPEHLAQAFDRFWRAPDAPHGGSGIGLAVVQHLAQLSGGRVELNNRHDRSGLVASVVLPAGS